MRHKSRLAEFHDADILSATLMQTERGILDVRLTSPSIRTCIGVLIFVFASGIQHDCHAHLASLKKYSLPDHPVFNSLICPHYFAECMIYLALSIIAAPSGHFLNGTIVCALIFVVVNLGVTADGTKRWYEEKFGADKVAGRWRMIPYVY